MTKIFNKKNQIEKRKSLRNNATAPEKKLWTAMRAEKLGVKFRRQHGIGEYIADFYCPELKMVIELDGHSHFGEDAQAYDKVRDEFMQALGLKVIRLLNTNIMQNFENSVIFIQSEIEKRKIELGKSDIL